jgi:hypothetical protein
VELLKMHYEREEIREQSLVFLGGGDSVDAFTREGVGVVMSQKRLSLR